MGMIETNELPNCLQVVRHYFEQIVSTYNEPSYKRFKAYVTDAILRAGDLYHKDVGPITVTHRDLFFRTHLIIYEKNTFHMIIIFF